MDLIATIETASRCLQSRIAAGLNDGMAQSAALCISDATRLWHCGQLADCRQRALKAIAFCVGICHPDYIAASK